MDTLTSPSKSDDNFAAPRVMGPLVLQSVSQGLAECSRYQYASHCQRKNHSGALHVGVVILQCIVGW
jgi:hypothetical protein